MMVLLVAYDVDAPDGGKRCLRHVAKLCENHGQRSYIPSLNAC